MAHPHEEKGKVLVYIGIGVVALVVLGFVFL